MREPGLFDDEAGGTVFRDVIMLALAGFVMLVLLLLPHVNPLAKPDPKSPGPGNVIVEIRWPDELDTDVDLWVQAPGDRPVGYSNKNGSVFNLLRDDLGHSNDVTGLNYEFSFSRGAPAGEYTVNVHLYRNRAGQSPVPVTVSISIQPNRNAAARPLLDTRVELAHDGEELTVFRFELDSSHRLVPGSVNDLPRALRSQGA